MSKTTVSHVLSGKRAVSPGTRERVQRSIDALGYRPSGPARSLRTRKTHMVALILPDITNPFYPVLARGLEEGLEAHGYRAFICSSDGDAHRERAYLNEVCDRGVDGIVLDSFHLTVDDLHAATGDSSSTTRASTPCAPTTRPARTRARATWSNGGIGASR